MTTTDPRQAWLQPYRTIVDEKGSDDRGSFRVKVVDFAQAYDRTPVQMPLGVERFGFLLFLGGPNDPLVGSEPTPPLALSRAAGLRQALTAQLNVDFAMSSQPIRCACCQKVLEEPPEPCASCGVGTCDECIATRGGCGCTSSVDPRSVREVALTSEVMDQVSERVAETAPDFRPTAGIPQHQSDLEGEAARLDQAARSLAEHKE